MNVRNNYPLIDESYNYPISVIISWCYSIRMFGGKLARPVRLPQYNGHLHFNNTSNHLLHVTKLWAVPQSGIYSKHIHENWWLSEHSQQPDLIFIITQYEDTQGFTISGLVCRSFLYYFIISHTNTDTHAHTVYLLCNSVHNFITKPLVSLSIYDSNRRRYICMMYNKTWRITTLKPWGQPLVNWGPSPLCSDPVFSNTIERERERIRDRLRVKNERGEFKALRRWCHFKK